MLIKNNVLAALDIFRLFGLKAKQIIHDLPPVVCVGWRGAGGEDMKKIRTVYISLFPAPKFIFVLHNPQYSEK